MKQNTNLCRRSLRQSLALTTMFLALYAGPASAQISPCSFDTTAPVITGCPANIIMKTGPGNTSGTQTATWTAPTAADNCSAVTATSTHQPGATFPKGITAVTYTFTDASSNSSSCTFYVCVKDNTPPLISGLSDITVNAQPGSCGAAVSYVRPTYVDNAPRCNSMIQQLQNSGFKYLGTFRGHDYFRSPVKGSWDGVDSIAQMVDGYLATISDAAEDSFIDATNRQIAWMGLTDRNSEGNWVWANGEPVTYRNWCYGQPDDWKLDQNYGVLNSHGMKGPKGCWDDGHSPGKIEVEVANSLYGIIEMAGCGSIRLTAGLDSGAVFPVGTTLVTWTAIDASGNASSKSFKVTVVDNEAPPIFCPANRTVAYNDNTMPAVSGTGVARATDNCSTPIVTSSDVSTRVADIWDPRHYNFTITRTWTAQDAGNNISSCTQKITVQDIVPPVASCRNKTIVLAGGTAMITPADINNGSYDKASPIASATLSKTAFSCSDIGANRVTLTVTDVSGNISTCTATVNVVGATCNSSIAVTPSSTVYTGGVVTDIYLGYGPQNATITANSTSVAPFTYTWSGPVSTLSCTTCKSPVFAPTAPGNYTFTATVANAYGCTSSSTVTFCVKDIRVSSSSADHDEDEDDNTGSGKVYICHVPNGNPSNAKTHSISVNAVPAHLSNHSGDRLGKCYQICGTGARMIGEEIVEDEVKVYPNPNNGSFIVELPYIEDKALIHITDVQGRTVRQKMVVDGEDNKVRFDLGGVARGIYLVDVVNGEHRVRTKLVVQ